MDKQTQTPKTQAPAARGYQNVMTDPATLAGLDALIGAALAAGYRPAGRRASRASIIADLVTRATDALRQGGQGGPQQAPSGPQDAAPACAAPAQQDTPQSPAEALAQALPDVPALPEFAAPRTQPARSYAPHYFAVHGSAGVSA